ncbi:MULTISPECIES: hypothetical protein [Trueperella]|uniref:Glyoxalase-like domain-containing protein n=1 Tax=Trueperella bernardiae TaxID=59561 RepID=A0AAW6ZD70_9ACTO|nr:MULTISPECIES: hypothetical protein [Trueperella]MCM3907038.1 hypothetical protein [Trueperella bernardiae]MDK8601652.1 hypothetical protein [Trueperella bernardiae]OCW60535.1 hypothetical protein AKG36_05320 [Trueperella bernardiae]OFS76512.1 hypothetical protein HMPREF3167_00360 [Trueperella sp. HMSC08B05]
MVSVEHIIFSCAHIRELAQMVDGDPTGWDGVESASGALLLVPGRAMIPRTLAVAGEGVAVE